MTRYYTNIDNNIYLSTCISAVLVTLPFAMYSSAVSGLIHYLSWIETLLSWLQLLKHEVYNNNYRLRYVVHGRGCNPHRSLWRHWSRQNSETITGREKRRPPRPMKSSELSNGENRIAIRQLLQNRKLRHLWRHNLGSSWKLQKMAQANFSIGAYYNITENQDNLIKTVGRDSFWAPKPIKVQVF